MEQNKFTAILTPMLTEKSNQLKEGKNDKRQYTFRVRQDANKTEIMKAISTLYNVKPTSCSIINVKPRKKNRRMSAGGYTQLWKKAIISLGKGEKIEALK
ncbi:MAG: 50S ribosomal protein L23 [Spirochaetota bacterium]